MSFHAEFEQWVPVPLGRTFLFFANPANLPPLMPPWMKVQLERVNIVSPPGMEAPRATVTDQAPIVGAGSELEASYRAVPGIPFRIHAVARITGFAMNQFFEDIQPRGPFKSWHHRHEFAAEIRGGIQGTLVRDKVDYEIGFGPLGALIQALFVGPQMQRTFKHRQEALRHLLR